MRLLASVLISFSPLIKWHPLSETLCGYTSESADTSAPFSTSLNVAITYLVLLIFSSTRV